MRRRRAIAAVVAAAATSLALAACSSGGGSSSATSSSSSSSSSSPQSSSSSSVTLTWWNNATNQPLLGVYQNAIKGFEAAHPGITITNVPIQKMKIPLALQGNNPPNIYQQWGGGVLGQQVTSGKVADITSDVASWIGG